MVIEITVDNDRWIRADLFDAGERIKNLYHYAFYPHQGIMEQYSRAALYVQQNFPEHKKTRIVNDLGAQTTTI